MADVKRKILIVGGGRGGEALVELFSKCDFIDIAAVVDKNDNAPGIIKAKNMGISTGKEYKPYLKDKDLDTIFNVTGMDAVQQQLILDKQSHIEVVGGHSAKIFWDLVESQSSLLEQVEDNQRIIKNILDSISQPFYVIDAETYEIVLMNKTAEKTAEKPVEQGENNKCYFVLHGKDHPCSGDYACPVEEVKKTKKTVIVERRLSEDKRGARFLRIYASPIFDKDGNLIQVVRYSMDITGIKNIEQELKRSREEFRTLINNLPGAIYRCTLTPKRSMQIITEEIKEITGYAASDFIGNFVRSFDSIIDKEDIERVANVLREKIEKKEPFELGYRIRSYKGEEKWVSDRGKGVYGPDGDLLYIDGAIFDQTEEMFIKQELKDSEERLETIINSVLTGIVIIEADTHIIVDANPVAENMIGLPKEQIIGNRCNTFICPAEEGQCPVTDLGQEVDNSERVLINKDGIEIPVMKTVVEVVIKGKKYMIDSFIDISDRKAAEKEIEESEKKYRMLADNIMDMIWTMDFEMHFGYVSPSSEKLLGYTPEELKKQPFDNLFPPESIKKVLSVLKEELGREGQEGVDPRRQRTFEMQHIKKDGSLVWVEVRTVFLRNEQGKPVGLIGLTHDITNRRAKDEALEKSAREWERTFNSIDDMISIHDKDFKIIRANRSFSEKFGLEPEEIKGKTCYTMVHGTDEPCKDCPFERMIKTKKTESAELFEPHLGVYLEVTVSPVLDKQGEIIGAVHIAKNISDRKTTEKALLESIKVKSDFTSRVSHELRTPLTAIKEGIGIVWDGSAGEINEEQKDFLGAAKRNVDRLSRLINEVLDFTKLKSGKMKLYRASCSIDRLIEDVVNVQTPIIKDKGLYLKTDISKDISEINVDSDKILQVLNNLVNNAVKFTETGGIEITATLEDEGVLISVKDTGVGIKEEDIDKVFKEFHQVGDVKTRKVGGTGLGLSISKEIIHRHGGKIWAESVPGEGTTFKFTLPNKRTYQILIIDDDQTFLDFAEILLTKKGYKVECAGSGEEGMSKIKEKMPDLIVLDMRLKDMNGYELIGRLRSERDLRAIPILAVSGYRDALSELDKLKTIEDNSIIPRMIKPFDNEEFLKNIKEMLE